MTNYRFAGVKKIERRKYLENICIALLNLPSSKKSVSFFFHENYFLYVILFPLLRSRSYKTLFSLFFIFADKLGHLTIDDFFLYVTNTQAYQRKMENFFVSEENKFYRIGSAGVMFNEGIKVCTPAKIHEPPFAHIMQVRERERGTKRCRKM